LALRGLVVAVADGVCGMKGGRVAAETCVRLFMDGFYSLPETLGSELLAARRLNAVNRWIHAMGQRDPALADLATTFTALILIIVSHAWCMSAIRAFIVCAIIAWKD